jgi:aminoglycoside phosphotransferase (APT) family kinase protein
MRAMRAQLSAAVRTWVERSVDDSLTSVRPLTGGWTSAMYGVTTRDGRSFALRVMNRNPWRRHGADLVTREAWALDLLADQAVPAARSVAVDPHGTTGDPAHLMTWLNGDLRLDAADLTVLGPLAGMLADIHRVRPPVRPRTFQSWAEPDKRIRPTWSTRDALWEEAFDVIGEDFPAFAGTFLHRDFHLGNVLWADGRISGVVDWVETSWGPAELDVAHCRSNLAMLHGADAADRFTEAYRARRPEVEARAQRYWDVLDIVGYLPDPVKVVQPWRDKGVDVSDEVARARLEEHLDRVLSASP